MKNVIIFTNEELRDLRMGKEVELRDSKGKVVYTFVSEKGFQKILKGESENGD